MLPRFEQRIAELAPKMGDTTLHAGVYQATLNYLLSNQVSGGCHLFAAILYVLFMEADAVASSMDDTDDTDADKVEYRMCIGVARSPDLTRFDHSWVEAGPLVYDVSVCLPMEGGAPTGGPVFASHDLLSGEWVHRAYLQSDTDSLDQIAEDVARWSLAEYGEEIWKRDRLRLWEIVAAIGSEVGFSFDPAALAVRYGSMLRVRAQPVDSSESGAC
jgi:hypothetical protein